MLGITGAGRKYAVFGIIPIASNMGFMGTTGEFLHPTSIFGIIPIASIIGFMGTTCEFLHPPSSPDSSDSRLAMASDCRSGWAKGLIQGECRSAGKLRIDNCLPNPCHEVGSLLSLSPRKTITNSRGSSFFIVRFLFLFS